MIIYMEPLITPALLASTGINVPDDQVEEYLDLINDQLAERIGESVIESLDEATVEKLADMQETASDEELNNWMQANIPQLNDIIRQEIDIILGDAAENSHAFNGLEKDAQGVFLSRILLQDRYFLSRHHIRDGVVGMAHPRGR